MDFPFQIHFWTLIYTRIKTFLKYQWYSPAITSEQRSQFSKWFLLPFIVYKQSLTPVLLLLWVWANKPHLVNPISSSLFHHLGGSLGSPVWGTFSSTIAAIILNITHLSCMIQYLLQGAIYFMLLLYSLLSHIFHVGKDHFLFLYIPQIYAKKINPK